MSILKVLWHNWRHPVDLDEPISSSSAGYRHWHRPAYVWANIWMHDKVFDMPADMRRKKADLELDRLKTRIYAQLGVKV